MCLFELVCVGVARKVRQTIDYVGGEATATAATANRHFQLEKTSHSAKARLSIGILCEIAQIRQTRNRIVVTARPNCPAIVVLPPVGNNKLHHTHEQAHKKHDRCERQTTC